MHEANDDLADGPKRATALGYAPSANVVSVRGFRLLVVLTLLNTALLGSVVVGPQLSGFVKVQWAAYQQRKADRQAASAAAAARQSIVAAEQREMTYLEAPGMLLYDDDPAIRDAPTTAPAAPWPEVVPRPDEAAALPSKFVGTSSIVLFMHERRASADSPPMLVVVLASSEFVRAQSSKNVPRQIWSLTIRPTTLDAEATRLKARTLDVRPTSGGSLRLFAGEPDSDDPSRFIIPFETAGVRGVIHGQLQRDGAVWLTADGPLNTSGRDLRGGAVGA